jgi:UDP-N-acetylglucosamine transferase subunit ALG13
MGTKKIKLALIATSGGHFEQLTNLSEFYNKYPHFWITNENQQTVSELKNELVYYIKAGHFTRPWTYLPHLPFFYTIFRNEKPTHIISTGSGRTGFLAFYFSKLFKIKFIYIDTFSRVNNITIFAKFLMKSGQNIYTQWENKSYDKAEYIGPVFNSSSIDDKIIKNSNYIFVTLGTRTEQFIRLIQAIEKLKKKGVILQRIKIQAGFTHYKSEVLEIFDFCSQQEIDDLILNSDYIITQESAGVATKCLKLKKRFIVMPRDYSYGELPTKSDMKEDLQYKLEELGYTKVVFCAEQLERAINNLSDIKTGYLFDNSLAIKKLNELVKNSN